MGFPKVRNRFSAKIMKRNSSKTVLSIKPLISDLAGSILRNLKKSKGKKFPVIETFKSRSGIRKLLGEYAGRQKRHWYSHVYYFAENPEIGFRAAGLSICTLLLVKIGKVIFEKTEKKFQSLSKKLNPTHSHNIKQEINSR